MRYFVFYLRIPMTIDSKGKHTVDYEPFHRRIPIIFTLKT